MKPAAVCDPPVRVRVKSDGVNEFGRDHAPSISLVIMTIAAVKDGN
jgi:hypothetical protein